VALLIVTWVVGAVADRGQPVLQHLAATFAPQFVVTRPPGAFPPPVFTVKVGYPFAVPYPVPAFFLGDVRAVQFLAERLPVVAAAAAFRWLEFLGGGSCAAFI
jgi:hypothetical protein